MSSVKSPIDSSNSSGRKHVSKVTVTGVRFTASICVLVSMGIVALLSQRSINSGSKVDGVFGAMAVLVVGFFGYEWLWVHSSTMTRQKRAYFDETNILETYQPRTRTLGHLFQPDTPTPVPFVTFKEGDRPNSTDSERAAFNANRDAHYANEYQYIMKTVKEHEEQEKQESLQTKKARR